MLDALFHFTNLDGIFSGCCKQDIPFKPLWRDPHSTAIIFFWAGMRYTADFLPSLTMLSAIGFWQGYRFFEQRLPAQNYYRIAGIILAGISVVVSTLLAISTA